jgi:hypothetical protein
VSLPPALNFSTGQQESEGYRKRHSATAAIGRRRANHVRYGAAPHRRPPRSGRETRWAPPESRRSRSRSRRGLQSRLSVPRRQTRQARPLRRAARACRVCIAAGPYHSAGCDDCQSSRSCGFYWQYLLSSSGTLVYLQCPDCAHLWVTDTRARRGNWRSGAA